MRVKGLNCDLSLRQRLIGWPSDSTFALADLIQEAYVQGVSTRSVDDVVKAIGMAPRRILAKLEQQSG